MKTHLSLRTSKIDESVAFYRSLLNADPHKRHDDYALFVVEQPGLELALDLDAHGGPAHAGASHFGIAVDSAEAVEAAIERLRSAGLTVDVERDTTCCYARQDKVWASDPDGRRWEVYHVLEESDERGHGDASCCTPESCEGFASCCG